MQASETARKSCSKLVTEQDTTLQLLIKQRNEALSNVSSTATVPFYIWVVVGIAGGVVLVRGLR